MKKTILLLFLTALTLGGFAQTSNVVLFTEEGERFVAILNGLRMNEEPVTNLKIEDLEQPQYRLKIIFEDPNLGSMDKNLYLESGQEVVMRIVKNRKGYYKLGYVSAAPIAQAPPAPREQVIVHWGAPPATGNETVVVEETTTTTTTTHGGNPQDGENVNISMNVDGFGMDVNVNANSTGSSTSSSMSTTTTTTTSTTTTSSSGGTGWSEPQPDPMPGYTGARGCDWPMDETSFSEARTSVINKTFEDSKLTIAKQITKNNCLTAAQVTTLTKCFEFESTRLEFAKFAYPYTFDQNNYFKVNDAFEFESSIEELEEYLR